MRRAPTLAAIHAAEMRVARARQDTVDRLRRGQVALRAALTRPSTVALAAGAAGLLTFLIARGLRPRAATPAAGLTARTSAAGLVATFVARYAVRHLPFILQQLRAALKQRAAPADADRSKWPGTGHAASGMLH
jgi:hypothetical protein